jgi:hypothetical protein
MSPGGQFEKNGSHIFEVFKLRNKGKQCHKRFECIQHNGAQIVAQRRDF